MNRSIDPFFPISISVFISPAMDGRALGARIAPLQGALVIGYRNRGKIDKSLDENATGHGGGGRGARVGSRALDFCLRAKRFSLLARLVMVMRIIH